MDKTVVIYSMNKAGSTTIIRALQSAGYDAHRGYAENIHTLPWRESPIVVPFREPFEHAISWLWEKWLMNRGMSHPKNTPMMDTFQYFPAVFWFDKYFEPLFGWNPIDDLDGKHGPSGRWCTFPTGKELFIRTDQLSKHLARGLYGLLGTEKEKFSVQHRAKGAERFGDEYEHFQKHIKVKGKIANMVIDSAYVQAFWTEEEQEAMRERWIK